jgi:hypothetical protein
MMWKCCASFWGPCSKPSFQILLTSPPPWSSGYCKFVIVTRRAATVCMRNGCINCRHKHTYCSLLGSDVMQSGKHASTYLRNTSLHLQERCTYQTTQCHNSEDRNMNLHTTQLKISWTLHYSTVSMVLTVAAVQSFAEKKMFVSEDSHKNRQSLWAPKFALNKFLQLKSFPEETCSWHSDAMLKPPVIQTLASRVTDIPY